MASRFLSAGLRLLGSIPSVGKTVKKKATKAASTIKSIKSKASSKKQQVAKILKNAKKKLKKKGIFAIGKVVTKARKIKNNLSKNESIQKLKLAMKAGVLATSLLKQQSNKSSKEISDIERQKQGLAAFLNNPENKQMDFSTVSDYGKPTFYDQHKVLGHSKVPLGRGATIKPEIASFFLDLLPFVGTAKGAQQAWTGVNEITGEKLTKGDRIAEGVGVAASIFPGGKVVGTYGTKAVIKVGDEVADVANNAYNKAKDFFKGTDDVTNQVARRSDPATYYTYDELHAMTKEAGLTGRNIGFESHHLLSKQFSSKFDVSQGDIISVPLTERAAVKNATPEQIWQAHRNVYEKMGYSDWARAIYDAHVKPLGIPYK